MNEVLPAGVVNVGLLPTTQLHNIGAAMSAHPDFGKIVFTGSCATGEKVMLSAANTMKRLTLELGGNDAGIVLPDVDPKAIAEGLFWGGFINNGQTCAAMKRLYVHEASMMLSAMRSSPMQEHSGRQRAGGRMFCGPIDNQMQFDKVNRLVADAKRQGPGIAGRRAG